MLRKDFVWGYCVQIWLFCWVGLAEGRHLHEGRGPCWREKIFPQLITRENGDLCQEGKPHGRIKGRFFFSVKVLRQGRLYSESGHCVSWHCYVEFGQQLGVPYNPENGYEPGGSEIMYIPERLTVILSCNFSYYPWIFSQALKDPPWSWLYSLGCGQRHLEWLQ